MKTIKIFLASSEELKEDRIAFGNLIRRLDTIYRNQGTTIELIVWEDLDISYNNCRKQEEYNDAIRHSDIFIALFHTLAGKYTREEFEVAREENLRRHAPKLIIHCRDLNPGEVESKELTEFKERLKRDLGHFWGRYSNNAQLHLDFVLWLQNTELVGKDSFRIEKDEVMINNVSIVQMSQLPFVADNERYKEMTTRIESLLIEVEQLRQAVAQMPTLTALQNLLQQKLKELNSQKDELERFQISLLDTAKRIADMQIEKTSCTLSRAIEMFNSGNLDGANVLLNEIATAAERHIDRFEQDRMLVHQDIEAFRLQAKTLLADISIPIGTRVKKVARIYDKTDDWAERTSYDKKKYIDFLCDFGNFHRTFAKYGKALKFFKKALTLSCEINGERSAMTADCYSKIGAVLNHQSKYLSALKSQEKALDIRLEIYGEEHQDTATSYNEMGMVCCSLSKYEPAIDYHNKSLSIRLKLFGGEHPKTVESLNNLGFVYSSLGKYEKSLEFYKEALAISEKVNGEEHPSTATSFNNIGYVYSSLGDYDKAIEYTNKALAIRKKVYGEEHSTTATSYNNLGFIYSTLGDFKQALCFFNKALEIRKSIFSENHTSIATTFNDLGKLYDKQGDYKKALEYYDKALSIRIEQLGQNHPQTATTYNCVGDVYLKNNDYDKALKLYQLALGIRLKKLDNKHKHVAITYFNLGRTYKKMGNYQQALINFNTALEIQQLVLPSDNKDAKTTLKYLEETKKMMSNNLNAREL